MLKLKHFNQIQIFINTTTIIWWCVLPQILQTRMPGVPELSVLAVESALDSFWLAHSMFWKRMAIIPISTAGLGRHLHFLLPSYEPLWGASLSHKNGALFFKGLETLSWLQRNIISTNNSQRKNVFSSPSGLMEVLIFQASCNVSFSLSVAICHCGEDPFPFNYTSLCLL